MRINTLPFIIALFGYPTMAEVAHDHGSQIFHKFQIEAERGYGRDEVISSWDIDGWIGKDRDKFHFKSEGEKEGRHLKQAEFWGMYSRNISEFWDVQAGFRHDTQPEGTSYIILGFEGLAPYFFETEAHIFVSEKGDVSARIRQENDLLITQFLVMQPYFELTLYAQDVPEQEVGGGISSAEIGLQTRYEFSRKFAPYVDVRYERKLGETSAIAKRNEERRDDLIASVGVRIVF